MGSLKHAVPGLLCLLNSVAERTKKIRYSHRFVQWHCSRWSRRERKLVTSGRMDVSSRRPLDCDTTHIAQEPERVERRRKQAMSGEYITNSQIKVWRAP